MTQADWEALAKKCEKATGPDGKLNEAIARALGYRPYGTLSPITKVVAARDTLGRGPRPRNWTGSMDAITALIAETLPGWAWKVGTCSVSDDAWLTPDFNCPEHGHRLKREIGPFESGSVWDTGIDIDKRPPGNPALALCAAFCHAMAHKAKE